LTIKSYIECGPRGRVESVDPGKSLHSCTQITSEPNDIAKSCFLGCGVRGEVVYGRKTLIDEYIQMTHHNIQRMSELIVVLTNQT